jgi:hypothetical protein
LTKKEVFEALRDNTAIPTTVMSLYTSFMKVISDLTQDIETEFLRLKTSNFQDEFQPCKLFSYTMDGLDHMMEEGEEEESWTDGEEEGGEEDDDSEEESQASGESKSNRCPDPKEESKKKPNGRMTLL